MPGRVSTRTSTASHISRNSSTQILNSRRSTTSPTVAVPQEGPESTLRTQICSIFNDAQRTTAGHRKLVVSLRKVQESCCYESIKPGKEAREQFDEDDFNVEIARCVIKLMSVKKSEGVGDRIVRFLGFFLRHASDKDAVLVPESEINETGSFSETASTRLTSHILSILLQFLGSKEKTVRYRSTQLVAHVINSLDSIDDEYYHLLKMGLLRRIRDKEPMIRVQAVLGLGRLAGNEDDGDQESENSDDDDVSGLLEKLLDAIQNDPSADVRRSLLLNLPLTASTLPYLLERARDLDAATRRALYSRLLPALGDFRHLSLSMREKLLRWGLRDRDENVRKATARLFRERWIEDCAGARANGESGALREAVPPSIDGLLELLERIDVVNSGVEEGIASGAMHAFWDGRLDYVEAVSFADPFWDHLSPESAFMARSFNDYCHQQANDKYQTLVEEKMPEVTKLAFFLQRYTNNLVDSLCRNSDRHEADEEEDTVEQEFIVEQLLHIAKTLDYSDEVGRRKMFALLRETLSISELPDEITKLVVDVLRDVCGAEAAGEREFCGVVIEAIAEVHDAIAVDEPAPNNEDESFHSARSEISDTTPTRVKGPRNIAGNEEEDGAKAIREITINMKCLHIAQCMLQNVEVNLHQNVHLVTMLNNLVVPAVRSHEAPVREKGLVCLGLGCLLDKTLADENLILFIHCFKNGHDTLQMTAIHILADILTSHPSLLALKDAESADVAALQKSIFKLFSKGMKAEHAPEIQSAATTALCKLMLTSVIQDEDLLKQAVICYFDPATKENGGVRQALSYFLPVYCHSRRDNMERMARVAGSVMHALVDMAEELDEGEEMVGISMVGNMLVDWTDARKLVVQDEANVSWDEAGKKEVKAINGDIHLDLAESLLENAIYLGCSREDKRASIAMLGKLYITANSSTEKLKKVTELVIQAIDDKIATDAASRNALNKLHVALSRAMGEPRKSKKGIEDTFAPLEGGRTTIEEKGVEESILANENDLKVESVEDAGVMEAKDSLLDELLTDEEDL
ncbi:hypothetical protein N7G274_006733 [Stereocaulon virgatum]|uniref:Nuclear condensin complex subunit 3 C-terminal domain-containing protein n=1 Tax=Stereocaulon virgatum TaxID=373712 RepID=A0ABR4A4B4_9LECA